MVDKDLLLDAFREFAAAMAADYDSTKMSYELVDRVTDALAISGAGVSVADEDQSLRFVTATSAVVVRVEEAQERIQEGPCVDAFLAQDLPRLSALEAREHLPK